jgi:hypothetical protein
MKMQSIRSLRRVIVSVSILIAFAGFAFSQTPAGSSSRDLNGRDDVSLLKQQIAAQQKQIEDMRAILVQMKQKMDQATASEQGEAPLVPNPADIASTRPILPPATTKPADDAKLRAQLDQLQKEIERLTSELAGQRRLLEQAGIGGEPASTPALRQADPSDRLIASTAPMLPKAATATPAPNSGSPAPQAVTTAPAPDAIQKAIDSINSNLRGFRLSGDLRFRTDLLFRAANTDLPPSDNRATPAQRARERYRFRLNVDKDLFFSDKSARPLAHAHVQLATDPFNNPSTMDTDFTGVATRAPISIAEAYVDFMPLKSLTFRVGRTPELFGDNRQFVFDDDIRVNGFHETYRWTGKSNGLFFQLGSAQYILTDPNVQIVPAGSPFLSAGYKQGQRVPSAALFDQGLTVGSNVGKKWSHNETINYMVYREPNQLALAATASGAALFATSSVVGATLTGNLPETGNALTTAGGAMFFADSFHIVRGGVNLNYSGSQWRGHNFPFQLFLQGTHNTGATIDENGYMMGAALGQAARLGDFQLQYQYFYKPANAFVSALTDDDVGTGAGVNVKTHEVRLNFGLSRFLAWENRLYIQRGISVNNPAINYFLPLQAGYRTQFRIHSQLVFTF